MSKKPNHCFFCSDCYGDLDTAFLFPYTASSVWIKTLIEFTKFSSMMYTLWRLLLASSISRRKPGILDKQDYISKLFGAYAF